MRRVALVTAAAARHLDEDLPPLEAALRELGVGVEIAVWDDPDVEWATFDLAVVRSTWDYASRRDELLAWADRAALLTSVVNPPSLLRWSTDKHYLADLAAAGVPVTPTTIVEPGDPTPPVLPEGEVVVKPAIGAGSLDAQRFVADRHGDAVAHVQRLLAEGRAVLVQPYVASVDDDGETALVFLDGELSHAVRKGPILRRDGTVFVEGLYAEEELSTRAPSAAEVDIGRAALAATPTADGSAPLYGRVDVVAGPDGSPLVLELELAEPSLFLDFEPAAAGRFAAAIVARVAHR